MKAKLTYMINPPDITFRPYNDSIDIEGEAQQWFCLLGCYIPGDVFDRTLELMNEWRQQHET